MRSILCYMHNREQNLGVFLSAARRKLGLSLRSVEASTGISNAYLSQLENGKIKTPAPQNLHSLAAYYSVPYALLMEMAGYPTAEPNDTQIGSPTRLAARIGSVTSDEEDQLVEYLEFIRARRKRLE
ncbi:helix-turn-helix transcriptional regulator [Rhizobium sp. VS19-DR104.2]|uniref:helix-turn-helix domain-containing protein n=1 Tax=unclassified Rhizobium TaxID=2613769 RepID=UPI001CC40B3A|nr:MULTISPECIES: helix-turn-helix transcriptional regulator [unclassified Rhizobium]MBZ5762896.1 helix-turn-helix transcriptional regulator [Rhizobium sp. VS19-DR96]MBZ5768739.1 helix-turn-helix transcriptional regulator [Rhizobium sp. VS19-DR129.2]MBZ5776312.1 helix-turn-helix transcriptional regulator [Rhizobium sp. VS19-DRK62.2]MBZ5787477.1 helix-turn-helix transcriptional regulator [Rhizobium sp. VS19-DR121]MBZ5804875.1 helix-turn-helix transcriptional regulator [Rhizobium sp. VS19-DR181]